MFAYLLYIGGAIALCIVGCIITDLIDLFIW